MISLETKSPESPYYEASFAIPRTRMEQMIEEIQKGNHQAVIDYLNQGGSLNDHEEYYPTTLGFYCFRFLDLSQIKEILAHLPEEVELPLDSAYWVEYDSKGEQIDRFLELMPILEKFHYSFEEIYKRSLTNLNFKWIDFFLQNDIPSLDLNHPVTSHIYGGTIHPYINIKMYAGYFSVYRIVINSLSKIDPEEFTEEEIATEKKEIIEQSDSIDEILHKMEHHPKMDFQQVRTEMDHLRAKGYYFQGDPELETSYQFFAEAMTFDGMEKQVSQGFNLYEPMGRFFADAMFFSEEDTTWIEFFSHMYGEYELVQLMERYHPQL